MNFGNVILSLFGGLAGLLVFLTPVLALAYFISNHTNGSLVSGGEKRKYLLHVPKKYDPSKPAPLVVVIHGFAQWPANQAQVSQWNPLANEKGFIVVYPSGTGMPKRWRGTGFGTPVKDPLIDVSFISALIDKLEGQYNIDPSRIYVTGLSNGGGMSLRLSCALSDRIAAIGGVAGAYLYPVEKCERTRSVPMMVVHGDADKVVPYHGGPSHSFEVPFPSIPGWVKDYASFNNCQGDPQTIPDLPEDVSGLRYTGSSRESEVVFYTVYGGGHSWPGGKPLPKWIVGKTSRTFDTTRVMWDFFVAHPLK